MKAARWVTLKARAGRALLLLLILSAVAAVLWYRRQAAQVGTAAPPSAPVGDSNAEMVTRDFRHVETRMDRTIWVLESKMAEIFGDGANLHDVRITWHGEPGDMQVVVTSAEGSMDFKTRNAMLTGKVRLQREDGAVLETEQLHWNNGRRLLRAAKPVVITAPGFTFRGSMMDADLDGEKLVLYGRVEGEVRPTPPPGRGPS